ncbi:MAG: thermonuclease family protein [Rhodobacteraceae bacterium]|nr:MAG: thermonuclease family protein [Paracoccaceae bacterium]
MARHGVIVPFPQSGRRVLHRPPPDRFAIARRAASAALNGALVILTVLCIGVAAGGDAPKGRRPAASAITQAAAATPAPSAVAPAPPRADLVSAAVRVRDGDTIVVGGQPLRLSGLHCPELREPGGPEAAAAMRRLVAGAAVSCALTGARSYDRVVGRCAARGADLGEALIRAGLCARCPRYDGGGAYGPAQAAAGPWPHGLPRYC